MENILELTILAYSAVLTTILLIIQYFKNIPRVEVNYSPSPFPDDVDILTIYNNSINTMAIYNVEIVIENNGKRRYIFNDFPTYRTMIIQPKNIYEIEIEEPYRFHIKDGDKIFTEISIYGKIKVARNQIHPYVKPNFFWSILQYFEKL